MSYGQLIPYAADPQNLQICTTPASLSHLNAAYVPYSPAKDSMFVVKASDRLVSPVCARTRSRSCTRSEGCRQLASSSHSTYPPCVLLRWPMSRLHSSPSHSGPLDLACARPQRGARAGRECALASAAHGARGREGVLVALGSGPTPAEALHCPARGSPGSIQRQRRRWLTAQD